MITPVQQTNMHVYYFSSLKIKFFTSKFSRNRHLCCCYWSILLIHWIITSRTVSMSSIILFRIVSTVLWITMLWNVTTKQYRFEKDFLEFSIHIRMINIANVMISSEIMLMICHGILCVTSVFDDIVSIVCRWIVITNGSTRWCPV